MLKLFPHTAVVNYLGERDSPPLVLWHVFFFFSGKDRVKDKEIIMKQEKGNVLLEC